MPKVRNKKAIANIARKSFKSNPIRNIVAILALILTTVMITSIFMVGGTIMNLAQQSSFRMVGTSSHGAFKYLTQDEFDTIRVHPDIKAISYDIAMAIAENPELSKVAGEIRYSEDDNAKWCYSYPTTGNMPQKYKELATSTIVLDALGISHELGQEVRLIFKVKDKEYSEVFTLVGFWEGDRIAPAQQIFLSEEFVLETYPFSETSYVKENEPDIFGKINAAVWFSNSINLEKKLNKVISESGYAVEDILLGVNWAYASAKVDPITIIGIFLVLVFVMLASYLLIYNIFYISITKDIRFYGLLKTIGTTEKQIKAIIRRQALGLLVVGIPIGLLLGYIISKVILPSILSNTIFQGETEIKGSFWIFLLSGIFATITLFISTRKPIKIASKISPIDATRVSDSRDSSKKFSKTKKVSVFSLAIKNMYRSKKKFFIVVTSLLLSLVIVLSIATALNSFDMDLYVKKSVVSDFTISNPLLATKYTTSYVDNDTLAELSKLDGISKIGGIYFGEIEHTLTQKEKTALEKGPMYDPNDYAESDTDDILAHIYGIDEALNDKLEFFGDSEFDEKFATGNYLYVSSIYRGYDTKYAVYEEGDVVTIDYGEGITKDYTVLGYADIPYSISIMHSHGSDDFEFIIPSSEYQKFFPDETPIRVISDVKEDKVDGMEQIISDYCEKNDLFYTSKATVIKEFEGFQAMYVIVGGILVVILTLIGILNFVNTMLTSVITRKTEFATLQSIGLTDTGVKRMLIYEGLSYAGTTILLTLTFGQILVYLFTQLIAGQTWFFKYNYTITPILLCIPILALITYLVPIAVFRNVNKESIVERLRRVD